MLAYRHIWKVTKATPILEQAAFKLPDKLLKHGLECYIVQCEPVKELRPMGLQYN